MSCIALSILNYSNHMQEYLQSFQRDLKKLQVWEITDCIQFNNSAGFCTWNGATLDICGDHMCEAGEQPYGKGSGVLVDGKLNISQQCVLAAERTPTVSPGAPGLAMPSGREKVIVLCTMFSQLEHCVQFWAPQYKVRNLLESVQERVMKMMNGLEDKVHEEC